MNGWLIVAVIALSLLLGICLAGWLAQRRILNREVTLPPESAEDKIAAAEGRVIALERQIQTLEKAVPAKQTSNMADMMGLALKHDPQSLSTSQGFVESISDIVRLDYSSLRQMAAIAPFAAVIQTRLNQISEFARPQESVYGVGYKVKLRDTSREATRIELATMHEMNQFFLHCGVVKDVFDLVDRTPLEGFLRMLMRDSLRYDSAPMEVLFDRKGRPAGFQAVDGATIRKAKPATNPNDRQIRHVQVLRGRVVAEWEAGELCMGIRRPRTDLGVCGYGYPELEEMVQIVTAWLYGFNYNMAYFRQGSATKGFLKVVGDISAAQFEAIRRSWLQMVSGIQNAHKTPIFNVPNKDGDIDFVSMQFTNNEMQFAEWMNWLLKLGCAIYQIDPAEVNFKFGNEGQGKEMFESNQEARIRASKDKGLRPLLRSIESWFNSYILWRLYPEFEFRFMGLDGHDEAQQAELDAKRAQTSATVNEIRREQGKPDLPWGDIILNPTAFQAKMLSDGMGMMGNTQGMPSILELASQAEGKKEDQQKIEKSLLSPSSAPCSCGNHHHDTTPITGQTPEPKAGRLIDLTL